MSCCEKLAEECRFWSHPRIAGIPMGDFLLPSHTIPLTPHKSLETFYFEITFYAKRQEEMTMNSP